MCILFITKHKSSAVCVINAQCITCINVIIKFKYDVSNMYITSIYKYIQVCICGYLVYVSCIEYVYNKYIQFTYVVVYSVCIMYRIYVTSMYIYKY
jgi:hypothetical protein